jgi:hypothetical protein
VNRAGWQFHPLTKPAEFVSQMAHPMHERLAPWSEPAVGEADRVTHLPEGSVVVEGFR